MAREHIDDDTEIVWQGPAARIMRPMSYGSLRRTVLTGSLLYVLAGAGSLPVATGLAEVEGANELGLLLAGAVAVFAGVANVAVFTRTPLDLLQRVGPPMAVTSQLLTPVVLGFAVVSAGPLLTVVAIFYIQAPLYAFFVTRTWWATGYLVYGSISYATALNLTDGVESRFEHWLIVGLAAVSTAVLIGDLVRRLEETRSALADLNRNLEQRVATQVDELERVGRLRRFLAPQVADVVMAETGEPLLEPHRTEVAVLFCDLRGFTRFTNSVDADTVVAVLAEYYARVGAVLEAHGATVGGYEGDGIMAYLGDPIPRSDAAPASVAMAREIGGRLDELTRQWQAKGHDLGYGIGLAYGPATLGVVGFDGRFDYTALGAVVNLASRLCADAASGEIVVDDSVRHAAGVGGSRRRGEVTLKGFDAPVATYALGHA